jgi:hypothetical protein
MSAWTSQLPEHLDLEADARLTVELPVAPGGYDLHGRRSWLPCLAG